MLESRCRAGHQTLFPERVPVRALLSGLVLAVAAVVGLAVLSGTADAGLPGSSGFAATSLHVGPEAENDAFIGVVGDELSFDICVNDTEGHGDTVLSREFGGYAAGLERSGCVISGIASVCGTRLYRYRATDATGTFATATVAITIIGCEGFPPAWVTPTPVPPTAVPATATRSADCGAGDARSADCGSGDSDCGSTDARSADAGSTDCGACDGDCGSGHADAGTRGAV